jgi:shikimate dehydrogenase
MSRALSGKARIAGLMGWPVGHSRSPALHGHWLARYGIDGAYVPLAVAPDGLERALRALPLLGFRGCNLTVPHKEAALRMVDRVTERARRIGAVNTVTIDADGRLAGDNSDGFGFIESLRDGAPGWLAAAGPAVVLGAGGAARAAAWALADAGARVTVWNRTPKRAKELASDLGVEPAERPGDAELLVNATTVGLRADDSLAGLPLVDARVVVDLVYGDAPTPIARWAEERGARLVDGLEVLVRQGARSIRLWTGMEPPVDAMRRAVVQPTSSTSAHV